MLEDGSELLEKAKRHQNWICYFWKGQMLPQTPLEMELGDFEKRKTTSKGLKWHGKDKICLESLV